jgi:hypothetical protein
LFDLLEIEECLDWEPEKTWIPTTPRKTQQVSYDPEPSLEDVSFALYCFLKDMTEIRVFIRRTWREYKHRQITLNSAAVTVNSAIDVMRHLNEAFVETHPNFAEHKSLMNHFHRRPLDVQEAISNCFTTYEAAGIHLTSMAFFCEHTTRIVTSFFGRKTGKNSRPVYQRHLMDGKGVPEEEHMLLQCLTHFGMIDHRQPGTLDKKGNEVDSFNDHIQRAIHTMRVEKKFPTWAIFACQVFVDARRELGPHLARGLQDLQEQGSWLIQTWAKCIETGKNNNVNDFHKVNDGLIQKMVEEFRELIEKDGLQDTIDRICERNQGAPCKWGKHFLMKNHPLLCGLALQHYLVRGHQTGVRIVADQGPVTTCIHLTHAVAIAGIIPVGRAWADLDYIISKHGAAYIFVGERPTKLSDCNPRMGLSIGIPASRLSLAKSRKKNSALSQTVIREYGKQKLLRRLLPISRYVDACFRLVDGATMKYNRAADDPFVMMEVLVNRLSNSQDVSCPANPHNEKPNHKWHVTTPLQSLKILKQVLKEDDLPLRFDLMSLNWRCIQLLRRIQRVCVEESSLDYPADKYGGDRNTRVVISKMLNGESGVPHYEPTRFIEACATVFETIAKEGAIEYRQAVARRGILHGTAIDPKDDPEDFEDPAEYFAPRIFVGDELISSEELAHSKSVLIESGVLPRAPRVSSNPCSGPAV